MGELYFSCSTPCTVLALQEGSNDSSHGIHSMDTVNEFDIIPRNPVPGYVSALAVDI